MEEKIRKTTKSTSKKEPKKKEVEEKNTLFEEEAIDYEIPNKERQKKIPREVEFEVTNITEVEKYANSESFVDNSHMFENSFDKNSSPIDFNKPIYIEIHKGNIFHYFASAILTPSKYISNRAFPDIQSIQNDALLVANCCSNSVNEDLVLIEILISNELKKSLVIKDNFALLFQPLPISRIKNVFVKSESIKNEIIKDSLVFDGGYIPEGLIQSSYPLGIEKNKFAVVDNVALNKVDYSSKINKFDRILGLLAFIRNYNILLSEKTNSYKTLPNHFFYAIQAIDSSFGSEIVSNNVISEFYSYLFNDNCPSDKKLLKWLFERLDVLDNFNETDTKEFESIFYRNSNDVEYEKITTQVFSALRKNMERKGALESIEWMKLQSGLPLYLFSFLRNYANLSSIEISRRDINHVYSPKFGEYSFALLGYFFGYKNLRNSDERINQTNTFLKIINTIPAKPPVKFQLTTEFDYLILELVFNHSFFKNISQINNTGFDRPTIKAEQVSNKNLATMDFGFTEVLIHGKLYQSVIPIDLLADLLPMLNKLPNDISLLSEFGWYCYKLGINMKPVRLSDIDFSIKSILKLIGYSKEDLMSFIEVNKKKIDIEELKVRIKLSQKSREI
jgi:hypothetical protein